MVAGNNVINDFNKTCKSSAISITMAMWWYDAVYIPQSQRSGASLELEATGCRYWVSAHAVLPRWLPRLSILAANVTHKNTNNTHLIANNLQFNQQQKS